MGVSISRYSELASNEYLARFCSAESISPNDPFWNKLLAFNINPPKNAEEQLVLDSSTETLLHKFLENNTQSGNLGSLVRVFITRATEQLAAPSSDNAMLAWQTFNALFVIRAVTKYLIETIPEYQLCQHFDVAVEHGFVRPNGPLRRDDSDEQLSENRPIEKAEDALLSNPDTTLISLENSQKSAAELSQNATLELLNEQSSQKDKQSQSVAQSQTGGSSTEQQATQTSPKLNLNESKLEMLIDALVGLIIDVPVTDNTYYLHLECINTLLVLMSVYMFAHVHGQGRLVETSLIYRTLFQGRYSMHAPMLVKTLLTNVATMYTAPEHMFGVGTSRGSVVLGLASGIWQLLTLNKSSARQSLLTHPPLDQSELAERLSREHSVANQSCLLLLAFTNHCMNQDNLYRRALFGCEDAFEQVSTSTQNNVSGSAGMQVTPPRVDLAGVHRALCLTAGCEHSTLLLYLMLHGCGAYKKYVCGVANVEHLIIPILQCLYKAPDSNSHHIYMSLIILLILTEDDSLIKSVHQISIKSPAWYTERTLSEISLGGLMALVLVRTAQYNILRVRDKYLHTNCLAALANMSSEFRNLHPYVAQRLVSLFETLSKRRTRLLHKLDRDAGETSDLLSGDEKNEEWDSVNMKHVLDEVLRMLLEILNSCLSNQLPSNLNLVYALLYKKQLFTRDVQPCCLHDILQNVEMVVGYFSSRLQRVQDGVGGDLGVTEVMATLKRGAEQWSNDRLKKFPELKFRYVEEDRPEEFFTPYVWSLVGACGGIYWASESSARAHRDLVNC